MYGFLSPTHIYCTRHRNPRTHSFRHSSSSFLLVSRNGSFLPQSTPCRSKSVSSTKMAAFDFVKKAAQEQKRAFQALREGRALEYIQEKAKEDLSKVNKFKDGLIKSRERLAIDLERVLQGQTSGDIDDTLEELEEVLITADIGVDTAERVLKDLKRNARDQKLVSKEDIKSCLKASLVNVLENSTHGIKLAAVAQEGDIGTTRKPVLIMVIGANGMGKTTTIGKLATRLRRKGNKVLLAACDTFRAAAVEQLEEWARRAEVDIIIPTRKRKSSAALLFDALEKAEEEKADYLIVDTSGRLHTNINLMGELQKMFRVVSKFKEGGPDETLLVVDATIGRNAVIQASTWNKEVGVSGLVITKLDGTARAGFVVSVVNELGIPVKLVGVGESVDDLQDFDASLFVEGLVG